MAQRGDKIVIYVDQYSSGTANAIIAESTSANLDISIEALETTSQADGLNATYIGGKVSGTVSGDYLLATTGAQFANLFTKANAAEVIGVSVKRDGTAFIDCDGVITSLSLSGGLSDSLATGAYTIQLSGDPAV